MPIDLIHQRLKTKESGTQYRTIRQVLHLDIPLIIGVLCLISFGFVILYSAGNQNINIIMNELGHFSLAATVMFILAQIPPHTFKRWTPWLFGIVMLLLVAVLIIGKIDKGAQRWLNFGLFRIQPSEVMKIILPMTLAWFFTYHSLPPRLKELGIALLIIFIPALLIAKEPDLGTAIMLILVGFSVLFLAGIKWRFILSGFISLFIAIPILFHFMHDYQRDRILTFLNPQRDPLGAGYHIIQSKIAIGSGGILGKGWLMGTQSHLQFLPEHSTDFIFAVCGEEFGLIGCCILLLIYSFITLRCFYIAVRAQDTYTRLLAGGLTSMFFFSIFINIGMVCGILPVVGLPLPLISYGGSSMVSLMASFGILMSIKGHEKLLSQ